MLKIKVVEDFQALDSRIRSMTETGQKALISQAHADMNNYVPLLEGDLRNQSQITVDGKSVIWNSIYAGTQYYGVVTTRGGGKAPIRRYSTPGTGPKWDSKAFAIHGEDWKRVAVEAMKLR